MVECTTAPEDGSIIAHREGSDEQTIALEYKVGDHWIKAAAQPVASIRAYELKQLRKRASPNEEDGADTGMYLIPD